MISFKSISIYCIIIYTTYPFSSFSSEFLHYHLPQIATSALRAMPIFHGFTDFELPERSAAARKDCSSGFSLENSSTGTVARPFSSSSFQIWKPPYYEFLWISMNFYEIWAHWRFYDETSSRFCLIIWLSRSKAGLWLGCISEKPPNSGGRVLFGAWTYVPLQRYCDPNLQSLG